MSSSSIDAVNQAIITGTQNKASSTSSTTSSSSSSKSSTSSILGKDDFLKLLVAQMQNQDPLNPSDPTQFTSQLAQFSSLEQLYNLNDSMKTLATSNTDASKLTTLGTIGKDVAYAGSTFNYDGQPVKLGYQLDNQAQQVIVSIKKDGTTIATLNGTDLSKGTHYLTWDGLTGSGAQAASGDYTIAVDAKPAEGDSVTATPVITSEVTGVDLGSDSTATLVTKSGSVASGKVLGVFDKSTSADTTANTTADTTTNTSVQPIRRLPDQKTATQL